MESSLYTHTIKTTKTNTRPKIQRNRPASDIEADPHDHPSTGSLLKYHMVLVYSPILLRYCIEGDDKASLAASVVLDSPDGKVSHRRGTVRNINRTGISHSTAWRYFPRLASNFYPGIQDRLRLRVPKESISRVDAYDTPQFDFGKTVKMACTINMPRSFSAGYGGCASEGRIAPVRYQRKIFQTHTMALPGGVAQCKLTLSWKVAWRWTGRSNSLDSHLSESQVPPY